MRYVVTAVNNLTGEREAITVPCSLPLATSILDRHKKEVKYKRKQPWSKFRIEEESFKK